MNLVHHHNHQSSAAEEEFHFWTGDRFRFRNHTKNSRFGPHSPPRSMLLLGGDDAYNMSAVPLLPRREINSSSPSLMSPRSRTRAIENGRKELMEMIRDLPESSFELSLKDLVVVEEHKNLDHEHDRKAEESAIEEKETDVNDQKKKKKRRKSANNNKARVRQVSRSSSMESGVFLIKLFPAFLTSKKPSTKPTNQSKVPSRMSSLENRAVVKESWNKNNCRSSSNIRSLSSSCRKDNGESAPAGCWPFDLGKHKIRRQKTCVF